MLMLRWIPAHQQVDQNRGQKNEGREGDILEEQRKNSNHRPDSTT